MPGINLAQSVSTAPQRMEATKPVFFGPGFFWGLFIFLLSVGAYGGVKMYEVTLMGQLATLEREITDQTASGLSGNDMSHVNDTYVRLGLIKGSLVTDVNPTKLIGVIEAVTVPSIRFTLYHYDTTKRTLTLEGDTSNFQYLAQQVMALKEAKATDGNTGIFSSVLIDKITMGKDGIHFGITAVGGIQ